MSYMQGISIPPARSLPKLVNLMIGTDERYSKTFCIIKGKKEEVLNKRKLLLGELLLSGITRKVRKLTLLSGSRYFPRAYSQTCI